MSDAVLVVDDEPHILQAIKRLLRRDPPVANEIHLTGNGPAALEILAQHNIAVIICDQRMPGMTGAEVLAESAKIRPDTFRITLTGYTDLSAAQRSINDGKVHHFLLKPWDDEHLRAVVCEGVRAHQMIQNNRRLEALTRKQKAELEEWNRKLEEQVHQRTEELRAQNADLLDLQRRLEQSLRDTVAVMAGMLEAYSPSLGIHSKRVARLACQLTSQLDLDEAELRDLEFAAHLHDIGKISRITADGVSQARKAGGPRAHHHGRHPEAGYAILSRVGGFETIARAVRHQHERYDGSGYPDGLIGGKIPLASRVIAVANGYDKAVFSSAQPTQVSREAGRQALLEGQGTSFDPTLVTMLLEYLDNIGADTAEDVEIEVSPKQISDGMILSRDLHNIDGVLLLKAGTLLTKQLIERVRILSDVSLMLGPVFVRCIANTPANNTQEPPVASVEAHCEVGDVPQRDDITRPPIERPTGLSADSLDDQKRISRNEPPRLQHQIKVLIVDDDPFVCNALKRDLRRAGFEAVATNNGWDALNQVTTQNIDVVVTDLMMPRISGEELVERLGRSAPDVACIILTGNASKQRVVRLVNAPNVAGILAKPWDSQRLVATLTAAIRDRKRKPA
ncbi:MAG: response regulator [Planctomycetes bacterium]|nr:response regulator [Planctomycetota bacterium]